MCEQHAQGLLFIYTFYTDKLLKKVGFNARGRVISEYNFDSVVFRWKGKLIIIVWIILLEHLEHHASVLHKIAKMLEKYLVMKVKLILANI